CEPFALRCDVSGCHGAGCPAGESCLADCSACATQCGDLLLGPGEACEPVGCGANGCVDNAGCPPGESCLADCSACAVQCGDHLLGPGETCEPFNLQWDVSE